jgi:chromosome partitioning protein
MPVIAMTSSKGGCAKSTTALILAGAFAHRGYTVRIIDADRAGRLADWYGGGYAPASISVVKADEDTLEAAISKGRQDADFVIVDLEGSANASIMMAVGFSDLSIIPANPSAPDVAAALGAVKAIRTVSNIAQRPVNHALLWSRMPTFRSRETTALEEQIRQAGIPILGQIMERTAYRSLFSFQTVLENLDRSEVPGVDKAIAESYRLGDAVLDMLIAAKSVQPK